MDTYLDESYARVWVDEFLPCVFTMVNGSMDPKQLEKLGTKTLAALKQLRKKKKNSLMIFSLSNFFSCQSLSINMVKAYVEDVAIPELSNGASFKLFVQPQDDKALTQIINNAVSRCPNSNARTFTTFEDALQFINEAKG
jgi:hypothetical protein